jgi:hypothetical protein
MSNSNTPPSQPSPKRSTSGSVRNNSVESTLAQISAILASSKDGGYLEKIADKLNAKKTGKNDPFAGFKIPQLTDIAKGLTFGLAPGLIKKSVSGMQIFMESLNAMNIEDVEKSSKIIELVSDYNYAVTNFGEIPWMKALKGTILLQTFTKRFAKIGEVLGSTENLAKLQPFRRFAKTFGEPLKLIGDSLLSFAKIKWSQVIISTMFLKKIMTSLQSIGEVFVGNEQTFEKMGMVMEKLTEPLTAFGESFKQIGNTLVKAAVSLLIVAGALGLTAISLKQFAGVPWDDASKGLGVFTGMMIGLAGLSQLKGSLIKTAGALAGVAGVLALSAFSMKLFANTDFDAVWTGVKILGAIMGGLVAMGILLSGPQIAFVAAATGIMALVGVALIPFAYGIKLLSGIKWNMFDGIFTALAKLAAGTALLSLAIPGMLAFAIAGIPFALSMMVLSKVKWNSITASGAALTSLAEGVDKLSYFGMIKAAAGIVPFAASIAALRLAIAGNDKISKFFQTFSKSIKDLKGDSLMSASAGILALSGALVAFAGTQVVSGMGNLIGKILRFGSDSPIEQLVKLAKHGYNLSILGMGVRDLANGLKTLAGFTSTLDIFETLGDKFKGLDALDPTGVKAFAEGINMLVDALTALSQLDGALAVLDQIPYDKLKSLSESIKPGAPLIQIVNGLKESEQSKETAMLLQKGIASQPPTVGAQLGNAGTTATSPVVIINNNTGGNVTNNTSTSSNVNNNGSVNTPIITASGSMIFTSQ